MSIANVFTTKSLGILKSLSILSHISHYTKGNPFSLPTDSWGDTGGYQDMQTRCHIWWEDQVPWGSRWV